MPRWLAIVITYVALVVLLVLLGVLIVPRVVGELQQLKEQWPQFQEQVRLRFDTMLKWHQELPEAVREQLDNMVLSLQEGSRAMVHSLFNTTLVAVSWVAKGMIILVLSIYLLLDKDSLKKSALALIPRRARRETVTVVGDVLGVIRAYLRGQIVVIGFVAITVSAVLLVFQIPYALVIGSFAGLLEVIPYFGAVAGAIPGVLYTFSQNGLVAGAFMIGFFIAINQIEGHVVIPLVMGRNLEMRPIWVLLSLLVGAELYGVIGLIVAVPVARILQVIVVHGLRLYKTYKARGSVWRSAGNHVNEAQVGEQ